MYHTPAIEILLNLAAELAETTQFVANCKTDEPVKGKLTKLFQSMNDMSHKLIMYGYAEGRPASPELAKAVELYLESGVVAPKKCARQLVIEATNMSLSDAVDYVDKIYDQRIMGNTLP